jgi:hypothetical protein
MWKAISRYSCDFPAYVNDAKEHENRMVRVVSNPAGCQGRKHIPDRRIRR